MRPPSCHEQNKQWQEVVALPVTYRWSVFPFFGVYYSIKWCLSVLIFPFHVRRTIAVLPSQGQVGHPALPTAFSCCFKSHTHCFAICFYTPHLYNIAIGNIIGYRSCRAIYNIIQRIPSRNTSSNLSLYAVFLVASPSIVRKHTLAISNILNIN